MTETLEYKGYWYLPSSQDNAVAGILIYTPNKSIKLELIGSIDKSECGIKSFVQRDKIEIIWGETSDAKKISLIGCTPAGGSRNLSCSFSLSNYRIRYCLVGTHINSFSDKKFNWCNVLMPALTEWCFPEALNLQFTFNKEKKPDQIIAVSFDQEKLKRPIASVAATDTTTLELNRDVEFDGSRYLLKPEFKQSTFLKIRKSDKSSVSDFLSDIFQFESFISLASLSTIKASKVFLFDDKLYQQIADKNKIYHPIELYYVQRKKRTKSSGEYNFLFDYSQIQVKYADIITRWFNENSQINPIRAHLVRSIEDKLSFDSTDFLIIIQAIEGFCNRFRKEQSLRKILESIIAEFDDVEEVSQLNINIQSVVDSRHYYSHFMNKSKKPNTLDGFELYILTQKLRIILICCVLNYIGIDNPKINELLKECNNNILHRKETK